MTSGRLRMIDLSSNTKQVCQCRIPQGMEMRIWGRCRTVRARCAHGSMFLGWWPNLYPVEWPP